MRYNDVIELVKNTVEYDEIGNSFFKEEKRQVFANKYQVSASEFYSENLNFKGKQYNTRNKASFQVRTDSYNEEETFYYNGVLFQIIRISDNGEFTLLVGVERIGKKSKD